MRKFVFILCLILACGLLLSFYSFEKHTKNLPDDAQGRGALIISVNDDCGSLDPSFTDTLTDFLIIHSLYEPLLRTPYGGGAPEAGCAQALPTLSSDGKTYTLVIRADAHWSNGDPVSAEDFRFAWMRALLPETACKYLSLMQLIKGAKDFYAWRDHACTLADALNQNHLNEVLAEKKADEVELLNAFLVANPWLNEATERTPARLWERTEQAFSQQVGIVADSRTLTITLEKPTPYFSGLLAFPTFSPLHKKSLEARRTFLKDSVRVMRDTEYFMPKTLISNGPYRFDEWTPRQRLVLNQNPYYWERDAMRNIRLVQRVVADNAVSMNLLRDNKIDGVLDFTTPALQVPLLEAAQKGLRHDVHINALAGTYFFLFNCRPQINGHKNPMANPKVRRALTAAINRNALTAQITRLNQPLSLTLVPVDSIEGYEPPAEAGTPFNPALAKKWWAEADENITSVRLLYNTVSPHKEMAVAIAKQWQDTLGIEVEQESCEFNPMLERRRVGNFEVARAGWYGDYADPTTFLDMFVTGNSNNDSGYSNPAFDGLMTQASNEADASKRLELLREAEALLLQDAPLIPLYTQVDVKLYDASLHDFKPEPWSSYRFECIPSSRR